MSPIHPCRRQCSICSLPSWPHLWRHRLAFPVPHRHVPSPPPPPHLEAISREHGFRNKDTCTIFVVNWRITPWASAGWGAAGGNGRCRGGAARVNVIIAPATEWTTARSIPLGSICLPHPRWRDAGVVLGHRLTTLAQHHASLQGSGAVLVCGRILQTGGPRLFKGSLIQRRCDGTTSY